MLHEEVARYRELSGDTNPNVPISRIGGYLDGYEKALEQEPCNVREHDKDHIWYKGIQYISLNRFLQVKKPCEDAISRQAVMDIVNNPLNIRLDKIIEKLPPVNPQPKTGKWKAKSFHELFCDNCGFDFDIMRNDFIDKMKYCPNCGAKMVEPQESEEIE